MQHFLTKLLAVLTVGMMALPSAQAKPRLILIVQEGLGHEMVTASRLYSENAELWDWRLDHQWTYASLSTLPLTTKTVANGTDPETLPQYDSLTAWSGSEVSVSAENSNQTIFAGYKWLIENATDRKQAATAIGSGIPSYNTSINWLSYPAKSGSPLPPDKQLIEWAHYKGLKTGIISDMPFCHDTNTILAGVRFESDESPITLFDYVISSSPLDLYVATGHPKYNELGQALSKPKYVFGSQNDWQDLRSKARSSGWSVIFGDEDLMGFNTQHSEQDSRRLVILQFGDTTSTEAISTDASGLSGNLATSIRFQTKMALDYLNKSDEGFVAVIHMGRLPYLLNAELQKESVEEVINAFQALVMCEQWIDENGGWEETSLVMASPYEYGLVWGASSSSFPYAQIINRGKKRIPGFRLNHKGPTATLSPLLMRGAIVDEVKTHFLNQDPIYGEYLSVSKLGQLMGGFVTRSHSKVEQP